jgi:hypothetical protein
MKKEGTAVSRVGMHFACIGLNDVQEKCSMKEKMLLPFVLACLMVCSAAAIAASTTSESSSAGGNTAIDAALKTCAASVAKDSNGGPDQTAMTACMTKAGFTKPSQDGERRPPPPGGSASRK